MRILFLMLAKSEDLNSSDMYTDLAKYFMKSGHEVIVMTSTCIHKTSRSNENGLDVVRVKTLPLLGINSAIKKGIGLMLMKYQYIRAYNKFLKDEKIDLVFMPTPPITLVDFVDYVKQKTKAKFYLILRDIHPQSLYSIGALNNKLMYNYLNSKAKKAYKIADIIGCMSEANIDYIKKIEPTIKTSKLQLLYNWMDSSRYEYPDRSILEKYGLNNKFVALFGGNIGKGQRIENIIYLAEHFKNNNSIVFLVIGKGIQKERLKVMAKERGLGNIQIEDFLPRDEYLNIVKSVDLGLISIDERYSVPTCPSKVLSYMSLKIPVLAMINQESDYGTIIQDKAKAGLWCVGGKDNIPIIVDTFEKIYKDKELRINMGNSGYDFFKKYLTTDYAYNCIINQIDAYEKIK